MVYRKRATPRAKDVCPNCGDVLRMKFRSCTGEFVCSQDCVRGVSNGEKARLMWLSARKWGVFFKELGLS